MKKAVIYALCGAEVAKAEACRVRESGDISEILLVAQGIAGDGAPWANAATDADGLKGLMKSKEAVRPDLFTVVISNEPGTFSCKGLLSAASLMLSLRPIERKMVFYSWSGRRELRDAAAEAARRVIAAVFKPLYLAMLRLGYLLGEALFPLLSGKARGKEFTAAGPGRVLVISLDLVGDLVWTAPAVSSIKKSCPEMEVHLLVANRNIGLAKMISGVDAVIGFDAPWLKKIHDPSGKGGWRPCRLKNLSARLKLLKAGYDLTMDFRGEPRDSVLAYYTGAPFRACLAGRPAGMLLTDDVPYLPTHRLTPAGGHIVDRHLGMAKELGFGLEPAERWLEPGTEAEEKVNGLLRTDGIGPDEMLVGIQPGASRHEKRWSREAFLEVARELARKYRARVILAGGADEEGLCRYISDKVPGSLSLAGRTGLPEFVSLVKACNYFISNETSAISIASAVGTPVICLMTGVAELYGPRGVPRRVIQKKPECYSPVGEHCFCPYQYKCLQDITPEEVVEAAESLMKETGLIP